MDNQTQNHITVEYERTIEDIIEFNLFHMSYSPSMRRNILVAQTIVALLVFLGGLAVGYIFSRGRGLTYLDYVVALVISVVMFYFFPYFNRREAIKALRKASKEGSNNAILGHQTISLTPENIFIEAQGGASRFNWSSIDRVAQNDKYIFLYTSSINALAIPKNAFSADKSLPEFLNYINVHLEMKN